MGHMSGYGVTISAIISLIAGSARVGVEGTRFGSSFAARRRNVSRDALTARTRHVWLLIG